VGDRDPKDLGSEGPRLTPLLGVVTGAAVLALGVALVAGDGQQTWFGSELLYTGGIFFGTFALLYALVAVFWWAADNKLAKSIGLPGGTNIEGPDEETAAADVQGGLDDRDQWQALAEEGEQRLGVLVAELEDEKAARRALEQKVIELRGEPPGQD